MLKLVVHIVTIDYGIKAKLG